MSHHESSAPGADGRLVDRMLFFSDAVFAIVLTLLALELRPPEVEARDDAALLAGLHEAAPHFIAFVASFALISIYWIAHMQITRRLRVFDWPVAVANLFFLLTITLIPFANDLAVARGWTPLAFALYGGVIIAASATQTICWVVASRDGGRLMGGVSVGERIYRTLRAAAPGLSFAIGVVMLATPYAPFAYLCWALIWPIMAVAYLAFAPKPPRAPA